MPHCWHCKTEFPHEHALRVAEGKFPLHFEDWAGWRFSGRFLIAPDRQRITAYRLRGLLFVQGVEARKAKRGAGPISDRPGNHLDNVATLPPRELFQGQA